MSVKRAVVILRNVVADATTGATVNLNAPSWARTCLLHATVSASAGTTPLLDIKVTQYDPDGGAARDTGVVMDQIAGSSNGHVVFGDLIVAAAGTAYDRFNAPVSKYMKVVCTQDRTSADETYTYKVWAEFIGAES